MIGRLYIDEQDAYRKFGLFLTEGSLQELIEFAPLKEPQSNDWPEEDGREVDLLEPRINTRELTLNFATNRTDRIGEFFELLAQSAYHQFDFREIRRCFRMRLVSQSQLTVHPRLEILALRLAIDDPLPEGYLYQAPQSTLHIADASQIDDRTFAEYGVCLLHGCEAECRKLPAVKLGLLLNNKTTHGASYDPAPIYFQSKDVKINCLMRAQSLEEFWRNYDALLFDLIRPKERMLYIDPLGATFPCYYKSAKTSQFSAQKSVWWRFELSLVFTRNRRGKDDRLLFEEAGAMLTSEEESFAFDLSEQ